jgi:hypothetical protein
MLPSGSFGPWIVGDDVAPEMRSAASYHRWMADYCDDYPNSLGGVILAAPAAPIERSPRTPLGPRELGLGASGDT